ncbi:MAG: AI-2E family transporter [Myxococcales bacterium]|nr:MAG: AI-2E family transporter [Myxococcales bacterium]
MKWLKLPRSVALLLTVFLTFVSFSFIAAFVSNSVRELAVNAPAYEQKVTELVDLTLAWLPIEGAVVKEKIIAPFREISTGTVSNVLRALTSQLASIVSRSFLVFMFVLFLLVGGSGKPMQPRSGVWLEIEGRVKRYVIVKGLLSATTGSLVGLTLWALDVDLAFVFGLLAFLLNIIPSIGSIIATLLPLPMVLVSPETSPLAATMAIVIPGTIQMLIGSVIEPTVMGESLDLHPVTVLMSLIFWGMLWGIIGALLAVPMTAVMKILLDRLEPTKPFAEMMAGRLHSTVDGT